MKNILLIIFLNLFHCNSFTQNSIEGFENSKITPWETKNVADYQFVYNFGDSEWETKMILIYAENEWFAQIVSGYWMNDSTWQWKYENLKHVKIEGNKFYSGKANGEFILYNNTKSLKIDNSWSYDEKNTNEISSHSEILTSNYSGKYPQASYRLLSKNEVKKMNHKKLDIMRNEIYARYGMIFTTDGKIDKYFKKQGWYQGQYKNVVPFLTELEKENIVLIREVEEERK